MTVAQTLFSRVKSEFERGNTRISKSEVIEWVIEYEDQGQKKHANGDTKARKLRMLVEANYLAAEYENGQAYIIPATGQTKAIEDTQDDETVPPRYRYEPIFENGRPTGRVKQIEITD